MTIKRGDSHMTDTLSNIYLEADTPTDIYNHPTITAAGLAVGTRLRIVPISGKIRMHAGSTAPTNASGYVPLPLGEIAVNDSSDTGLFITSVGVDGLINVGEFA